MSLSSEFIRLHECVMMCLSNLSAIAVNLNTIDASVSVKMLPINLRAWLLAIPLFRISLIINRLSLMSPVSGEFKQFMTRE